jgi:hypothetical protein
MTIPHLLMQLEVELVKGLHHDVWVRVSEVAESLARYPEDVTAVEGCGGIGVGATK